MFYVAVPIISVFDQNFGDTCGYKHFLALKDLHVIKM